MEELKREQTRWEKVGCSDDIEFIKGCENTAYNALAEAFIEYRVLVNDVGNVLMELGLTKEETTKVLNNTVKTLEDDFIIVTKNLTNPVEAIKQIYERDGIPFDESKVEKEIAMEIVKDMLKSAERTGAKN